MYLNKEPFKSSYKWKLNFSIWANSQKIPLCLKFEYKVLFDHFNNLKYIPALHGGIQAFPPRWVCEWGLRIAEHPGGQEHVANRVNELAAGTPGSLHGFLGSKVLHHVIQSGMKLHVFSKCFGEGRAVFLDLEPLCSVPAEHKQGPVRNPRVLIAQALPHLKWN